MANKYLIRENPALYEINAAAWLFELSQKLSKTLRLGEVPGTEWDELKSLGMDYVWLMGVWSRSQRGRDVSLQDPAFRRLFDSIMPDWTPPDVIGSSYSISTHEPDPLIGTWEDIDLARNELHKRGMGLILDFIPNHTGIDHRWLHEHPEYYIQGNEEDYSKDKGAFFAVDYKGETLYIAHGRDPNFPPWSDTAQLNYFNPETHTAMVQRLEKVGGHCDGVRCDMAMLILNDVFQRVWGWARREAESEVPGGEFWTQAIAKVPDLVYIAEAYWDTEWTLQQLGFDFVYDKKLYDRLRCDRPHDVYLHLTAGMEYQKKLLRFIENHDEPRSISAFGRSKVEAAAAIFSTLPGMRLFFRGQNEGRQIHLPLQIRQSKFEAVDLEIKAFYDRLLKTIDQEVFHAGRWQLKEVLRGSDNTAENLVACIWKMGEHMMLVIANLSEHPAEGRVCFQDDVEELHLYSLTDRLSGQGYTQEGKIMAHPGLSLKLNGYQAQIFEIKAVQ